ELRYALAATLFSSLLAASAASIYVDVNSTNALPPYTNWATAATTIQDAIDAANDHDQVLVADGLYNAGGYVPYGVTNRVTVLKPITVQSVHGSAATIIQGSVERDRLGFPIYSENNVRCAYLTNGAALVGFTCTNGATAGGGSGGGIYCESAAALVSNCILISNFVQNAGGGAYSGTLIGCAIVGNSGYGDGGGAYSCVLSNCTLVGNSSGMYGGGAANSTLWNCVLSTNSGFEGGGV